MSSTIFFYNFVPLLSFILLAIGFVFAPHNPYTEKKGVFECGFISFLGQNRTQFSISFFIFALLFLLFDLEILLVYPYLVSAYVNEIYGLSILLLFLMALTLGFVFELGKKALTIDSKQTSNNSKNKLSNNNTVSNLNVTVSSLCHCLKRPSILDLLSLPIIRSMQFSCSAQFAADNIGKDIDNPAEDIDNNEKNVESKEGIDDPAEDSGDNEMDIDDDKGYVPDSDSSDVTNEDGMDVSDIIKNLERKISELEKKGEEAKNPKENSDAMEDVLYSDDNDDDDELQYLKDRLENLKEVIEEEENEDEESEEEEGSEEENEDMEEEKDEDMEENEDKENEGDEENEDSHTNVPASEPLNEATSQSTNVTLPGPSNGPTAAGSPNQGGNMRSILDIGEFDVFSSLDNTFFLDILQYIADIPLLNLTNFFITMAFAIKSLNR